MFRFLSASVGLLAALLAHNAEPSQTPPNAVGLGFYNSLDEPVQVFWQKASGNEVLTMQVDPKDNRWTQGYVTHTFLARTMPDVGGRLVGRFTATNEEIFLIEDPAIKGACKRAEHGACEGWEPEKEVSEALQRQRDIVDASRLSLNENQPPKVPRFTPIGFEKRKIPDELWKQIKAYYTHNRDRMVLEYWSPENVYVNHYEAATYMIYLPATGHVQEAIKETMGKIISEWIGVKELEMTALYGIRLYTRGSILRNHVDRLATHAASAIINVDQDVDSEWPLEIFDHKGTKHEIFIKPGEMVLYESASAIHGRPTPFDGKYFANIFCHFRPQDEALWPWRD